MAFKEWAAICAALGEGLQTLIIRKGGIDEGREGFRVSQGEFWLFPTYQHEAAMGLEQEALPILERVEAQRPPPGMLRLTHYVVVTDVFQARDETLTFASGGAARLVAANGRRTIRVPPAGAVRADGSRLRAWPTALDSRLAALRWLPLVGRFAGGTLDRQSRTCADRQRIRPSPPANSTRRSETDRGDTRDA